MDLPESCAFDRDLRPYREGNMIGAEVHLS